MHRRLARRLVWHLHASAATAIKHRVAFQPEHFHRFFHAHQGQLLHGREGGASGVVSCWLSSIAGRGEGVLGAAAAAAPTHERGVFIKTEQLELLVFEARSRIRQLRYM